MESPSDQPSTVDLAGRTPPQQAALAEGHALRRRAAAASVAVASLLVAAKVVASLLTGSVALLASLVDSLSDLAASLLTMFSVRHAARPPDADHRFGHGKAEALSSLVQAALIGGSAFFVVNEAWGSLRTPAPLERTGVGMGVMVFAVILTAALVVYQRRVVRATGSLAIEGDSAHYQTDLLSALAVIAALYLERLTGASWIDPAIGVVIAIYLVLTAAGVGRRAVDELMDRELPEAERERIEALVRAVPDVRGMHDLRTRSAGGHTFVEVHIELDPDMRLRDSHRVAERVVRQLHEHLPGCDVLLHQDPVGVEEHRLDDVVARTESAPPS